MLTTLRAAWHAVQRALGNPFVLIGAFAAIAIVSALAAVWIDRNDIPGRVMNRLRVLAGGDAAQSVTWRPVSSHYHELQVAEFPVSRTLIEGGSIAVVGDALLMASPQGQLSYLDARRALHPLNANVPMNMEVLRQHPFYTDPNFRLAALRTLDLLIVPAGEDSYDLFASHDAFSDECIDFVVSQIRLRVQGGVVSADGAWRQVWKADGCLRFSEWGRMLRYPPRSGGRMAVYGDNQILVGVGNYDHVGVPGREPVSQQPDTDFGKLIVVNTLTGAGRRFAIGFRNPQGLLVDRAGRVWETEHGPEGGDEINLVRQGLDYGWPRATYGVDYTSPRTRWPFSDRFGTHDGYERPRMAFLPSIGISNLIEPNLEAFPNWRDTLLVISLRAQTLFVVRLDGDDIVYAEPIPLGHRLRDIAEMPDGSLAILTDGGRLMFVRNANVGDSVPFVVTGLDRLPPPSREEAPQADATPLERGRAYFEASCSSCHGLAGQSETGPPLDGVVGRDIASIEGYGYSQALRDLDGVWTEQRLRAFLANPNDVAPGTAMPALPLHRQAPELIVDYLKSVQHN
jgi:aldose sugar dehydrogenase